jgi:hypothetical protein
MRQISVVLEIVLMARVGRHFLRPVTTALILA